MTHQTRALFVETSRRDVSPPSRPEHTRAIQHPRPTPGANAFVNSFSPFVDTPHSVYPLPQSVDSHPSPTNTTTPTSEAANA